MILVNATRFWKKVNRLGPVPAHRPDLGRCWEWAACKDKLGYGRFGVTDDAGPKTVYAYRASYILAHGAIPDGLCVLHQCDNPKCVNPSHLFLGTRPENSEDMVHKGRSQKGEQHTQAKLTEESVRLIFRLRAEGLSQQRIADRLGVKQQAVSKVLSGQRWVHLNLAAQSS